MMIRAYEPKLSPEDERFVIQCLEDDELMLTIQRMNTKNASTIAEYISGAVGCEMRMANAITRAILRVI